MVSFCELLRDLPLAAETATCGPVPGKPAPKPRGFIHWAQAPSRGYAQACIVQRRPTGACCSTRHLPAACWRTPPTPNTTAQKAAPTPSAEVPPGHPGLFEGLCQKGRGDGHRLDHSLPRHSPSEPVECQLEGLHPRQAGGRRQQQTCRERHSGALLASEGGPPGRVCGVCVCVCVPRKPVRAPLLCSNLHRAIRAGKARPGGVPKITPETTDTCWTTRTFLLDQAKARLGQLPVSHSSPISGSTQDKILGSQCHSPSSCQISFLAKASPVFYHPCRRSRSVDHPLSLASAKQR